MLRQLDLFAGIGGFSIAGARTGKIHTVEFVEIDPAAQLILRHHFPQIPIHSDIRDYHPKRGEFDIITCGFPCTGTSSAGKRDGLSHPDSALWREGMRCLIEARPRFCIIEQPEGFNRRGLRTVLGFLDMAGYTTEIEIISAASLGAGHQRNRIFVISYPHQWAEQYLTNATTWSDQMRTLVQRCRLSANWLSVESQGYGFDYGLSGGLAKSALSVPTNTFGRITARYLAGRSVTPAQAAVALHRVLYLESVAEKATVSKKKLESEGG